MITKASKTMLLLVLGLVVVSVYIHTVDAALTVGVNHDRLKVGLNYHGSSVSLSGKSDPGVDIVLKVTSPLRHEKLMKKDRVAGIIWMNAKEVNFKNVHSVYFLKSTRPPEEIMSRGERADHGIGYDVIGEASEIYPLSEPWERNKLFKEFIKYKESKRLFATNSGDIIITQGDAFQSYYTSLDWPYQAPPGMYLVTAYAVRDGKVVEQAQTEVLVEQVGITKALAIMASNRGWLYGIVAITIALAAGFGVGMVFRKSGGAH